MPFREPAVSRPAWSSHPVAAAVLGAAALALAWGYWHAQTHASLSLRVEDYGLKTANLLYDTPHDVTLALMGPAREPLAAARSVEPLGYVLPVHPDPRIGNCEHRGAAAPAGQMSRSDYADCYAQLSAWISLWAPKVRRANVAVGSCRLDDLPVSNRTSPQDWWLWWVPLPHVGGVPRRHIELVVKLDSRACKAVP